jgi:hypothetical protein
MWDARLRLPVIMVVLSLVGGSPIHAQGLFSNTSHDFGLVPRGAQLHHSFSWTNSTANPLEIVELRTSCGCITATPLPRTLAPGQNGTIEVDMDTRKFVGIKNVVIHVLVGPNPTQVYTIQIAAHSRPDIVYNPSHVQFGVIGTGSTPTQIIEVDYAGTEMWRIVEIVNQSPYLTATLEETVRKAGQVGYKIHVKLKENAPIGSFRHELMLKNTDANSPVVPLLVEGTVRSSLTLFPSSVSFGGVKAGSVATRRVTIRSEEAFKILRVEGVMDGIEVLATNKQQPVQVVQVNWKPTEAGELSREIILHTDSERQPKIAIPLQGSSNP